MTTEKEQDDTKPEVPASQGKGRPKPAAGPHARKDLTNPMATPGAGTLPDVDGNEGSGISG